MILAVAIFFGALFLQGGINRARAWSTAPVVLPVFGMIILLSTGIYALVRGRVDKNTILTSCLCLLCLLSAIPLFVPMVYPASIASTTPSATVRLPANVPLKVMWGGDTYDVNYHVTSYSERWAYDFVVAPYFTGSANLEDYGCYGIPVVAPASGTIVVAHDGEPDMVPGELSNNLQAPLGNFIAIQLEETGTYLILAHLKQGSIQEAEADIVEEGWVIGQCGNSGKTSEPHIHIQHQRQDPNFYPPGVAEGLPLFFRDQTGAPMPQGGTQVENGEVFWTGATVQHVGK